MRRWFSTGKRAGAIVLAAIAAGALPVVPASGATSRPNGSPAAQVAAAAAAYRQAQNDMRSTAGTIGQLDTRIGDADREIESATQRVAADRGREDALRQQIGSYARSVYQTQGSQLTQVLEAQSVSEVWGVLAEARVVQQRQRDLLQQLSELRQADEGARDRAQAARSVLAAQRDQAAARLRALEATLGGLAAQVSAAGQVLAGAAAGRVPENRLPTTTGAAGQCTWYAEQAWVTYSDPSSPTLSGNGGDVVSNLARATNRPVEQQPQPGSLVSWQRPLMSAFGHVALVASVDRDSAGNPTGYTVWEMNYVGPFQTNARHVAWTGPNPQILFLSPPKPVDPVLEEVQRSS